MARGMKVSSVNQLTIEPPDQPVFTSQTFILCFSIFTQQFQHILLDAKEGMLLPKHAEK